MTFYPGDYNSKNAFLRDFLNDFEFTIFDKVDNPLRDNDKFMDLYEWLLSPMNDDLFDDIENFLIYDNKTRTDRNLYISSTAFQEEICHLIVLQNNNKVFKTQIRTIFMANMYKSRDKFDLDNVILNEVGDLLKRNIAKINLTESEISAECDHRRIC